MATVDLTPQGNRFNGRLVPDDYPLFGDPETDDEWQNDIDQDNMESEEDGW